MRDSHSLDRKRAIMAQVLASVVGDARRLRADLIPLDLAPAEQSYFEEALTNVETRATELLDLCEDSNVVQ